MTVAELRECLENLPSDTPVYVGEGSPLALGGFHRCEVADVMTVFGHDGWLTIVKGKPL